jgi:DNA polymerase elongation subunit (family B)
MASNLVFHLLDLYARDQRIEAETEDLRHVVYESDNDDYDDEISRVGRRYKKKANAGGKREYIIHLFGETAEGKSVRVDVVGYRPCFYLKLPEEGTLSAIDAIKQHMSLCKIPMDQVVTKRVRHESFWGFSAKTKFPFLYLDFPSQSMWRDAKSLFVNDKSTDTRKPIGGIYKAGQFPDVYEANIDPMLRFLHVQNLSPCGWVCIEDGMTIAEEEDSVLTLTCDYQCVEPCTTPPRATAPFLLASWDIECYSATGDFPIAKSNGNWNKVGKVLIGLKEYDDIVDKIKGLISNNSVRCVQKGRSAVQKVHQFLESVEFAEAVIAQTFDTEESCMRFAKGILGKYVEPCGDPVIQIGITLTRDCKTFERHLFVWPSCSPCEGIVLHVADTEKKMITDFFEWIVEINPDILIGYNVFGFDEKYVWERAVELDCVGESSPVHGLNRLQHLQGEVKLEEKLLSSSAMGDNYLYTWTTQGRLQIDLYHYIKRNIVLPSYKLDEVTKNFMSGKLKSYNVVGDKLILEIAGAIKDIRAGRAICLLDAIGESITDKLVVESVEGSRLTVACPDADTVKELADAQKWVVVKDDVSPQDIFRLHRGSADDRAIVGRYCLQDCDLVIELYKKLEVFNNAMSMANVCTVPISYIFMRGQGIKAESLIFKACRERGILIPVLPPPRQPGDGGPEESYEGAIVLDPEPGFYHESPIGVADFASLYPSTIESENISHDSLVWVKDYTYDGKLICVQFGSDTYAEVDGYGYTDIEFDIWRPDPADTRKHPVKIKSGRRICRYAQPLDGTKSTLPEIIRSLLAARKAKRKEAEKEKDPERAALLDAEQLAYKLTGNSLYGQLGSGTFKVRLQHLAASVTAYGRKQILFAKAVIERFYGAGEDEKIENKKYRRCDAKIMYGDTDSLFIEFNPRNPETGERIKGREGRQAVIDLTAEAGHLVTQALKPPHDFEFDKVFDPMLMFSKKRYAGLMFENNADDFVHKYMGIALKRRDNAPIVKTIFGGAMKKLLLEKDVPGATVLVHQLCKELIEGKVSLNQLTITKSLRADYADPSRIAHKALADRIARRDPGNAPASGDRIGFVYIRPKPGQIEAKLQGDRIETPMYVREKSLVPDYRFYIEHQIQNPVSQMFGILLEEIPGFDKRLLSDMPTDPDKRIAWRELRASEMLFQDALRKCSENDKKSFVTSFFGSGSGTNTVIEPVRAMRPRAPAVKSEAVKKVVQANISNYILDSYLNKAITKKDREAKRKKESEKDKDKS